MVNNAKGTPSNLSKLVRLALLDLKSNQSIIILTADKAEGTAVLEKQVSFKNNPRDSC